MNEWNVLFNDALNTFYLQLYDIQHMVKTPYRQWEETHGYHFMGGYSFWLAARDLLFALLHRQDSTSHDFLTPVVEYWL